MAGKYYRRGLLRSAGNMADHCEIINIRDANNRSDLALKE